MKEGKGAVYYRQYPLLLVMISSSASLGSLSLVPFVCVLVVSSESEGERRGKAKGSSRKFFGFPASTLAATWLVRVASLRTSRHLCRNSY